MKTYSPQFVFWEVTTACNLECIHCRRLEVGKTMSRKDLSYSEAVHLILGLACDFDPPPVLILSGGEPLIREDIFDIASFARLVGVPVALASNGTLIDDEMAKKISSSGIQRVSISLDGSNSETHDRFRKMEGSFEGAIRGIENLRLLNIPFQISSTLTKNNLDELEDIYYRSLELGANSLHYFLLVPVGCGLEVKEECQLSPEEYESALVKIKELSEKNEIHIRPICAPHYFRILAQTGTPFPKRPTMPQLNQLTKGCLAGTGICFISHEGNVFPCGYLPIDCGNIRRKPFCEIWGNAGNLLALRDSEKLQGKCGKCRFKNICSGCRARAFEATGSMLEEEPNCLYQPEFCQ